MSGLVPFQLSFALNKLLATAMQAFAGNTKICGHVGAVVRPRVRAEPLEETGR